MKLKKLLALTLAGAVLTVSLTACTPLDAAELLYDWLFGGGSSSASRGNGTGLVRSETLEESIIQWFGLTKTNWQEDEAEPMLQEVAKSFDPESWHYNNGNLNGELNDTAKAALKSIAEDKLTLTHLLSKNADVDVWEVQPNQAVFNPSTDRQLYEDSYYSSGAGANSNEPYHASTMYSYNSPVKGWIQNAPSFDLYAGVFQKDGKTYAAMVIIRWYS